MWFFHKSRLVLISVFLQSIAQISLLTSAPLEFSRLPSLPNQHGFAGSFAGVTGNALIVAGGANFPGKPPWEGGAKAWHDSIFVLDQPDGKWRTGFKLARSTAYGISVT